MSTIPKKTDPDYLDKLNIRENQIKRKIQHYQTKHKIYSKKLNKISKIKKTLKKKPKRDKTIQPITQDLYRYKIPQLKDFCYQRNLKLTGNKSDLIDRLRNYNNSTQLSSKQIKEMKKNLEKLSSMMSTSASS